MSKSVMIVAGESSGELYGALLTGKLKSLWQDVSVSGAGGERMRRAGVELFDGIASSFGLFEVLRSIKPLRESLKRTIKRVKDERPDVLVLIDYPDFNFIVGKAAKSAGIKVLYYVSPQVWAWRRGRVQKMHTIADKIAVLLPFEEAIYNEAGMPCEFVGHPAMDEIALQAQDRRGIKAGLGLDPERPVVAILPGSRYHEIKNLLPVFLEAIASLREEFSDYQYVLPIAPNIDPEGIAHEVERLRNEDITLVKESAVSALACADAAVVASGTAALQAAFVGTPHVVVYKVSPITYFLGRLLVRHVKYISLTNLLLDRPVVKELLQGEATPEAVAAELRRMLGGTAYRAKMTGGFNSIKQLFEAKNPSMRVAEIIGEMAGWTA